jgi:hypothetical protein
MVSKRRYFYEVKAHMLVTEDSLPVEGCLTPGYFRDAVELKNFSFELLGGSMVYGDEACNDYFMGTSCTISTGSPGYRFARRTRSARWRLSSSMRGASIARGRNDRQYDRASCAHVDSCDLGGGF